MEGLGDRFNGDCWVGGVRHEISGGNWLTDVQLGLSSEVFASRDTISTLPAAGLLPGISGLHTGVVAQIEEDPEGEARILVKIPMVSLEEEGVWARIATLDAGSERGTFFLPEVDDEVVLGFLNDDPRFPVILGMLHSSAKAPPFTAAAENAEKGFVSRSGMKVVFNDDAVSLSIETPGGNLLFLDEENGEITLEDQNQNSIKLSADGINIDSAKDLILTAGGDVKIESSLGMEAKAGTQFKAEGSAGLEVSSGATTTIKGSLVQIN